MNTNRRSFFAALGLTAVAGLVCQSAAARDLNKVRGRTFVAACPPVIESIPRTPGPQRVMVIGAHPDDADIVCGCTAAKLVAKGARVKFVAVCNGNIGHHIYSREKTAAVRRQETLNAAKVFGLDSYDIYGYGDARVPNDFEARELVARKIQEFEPDIIITHRDCDYHVDHRTVGTLVKDCGYMLGCPHWIEGSKPLRRRPLILLMRDNFTVPRVMRPDILVDADPYIGKWCDALDCQVSQFYEWLAWDKGVENEVKAIGDRKVNIAGRNAYLIKYWGVRKSYDANRFASAWREQYPGCAVPKMVEAYEISEYGRPPIKEDFDLLMGE
jgi:LmbE family N-acetylglucosaminyl deacetylase